MQSGLDLSTQLFQSTISSLQSSLLPGVPYRISLMYTEILQISSVSSKVRPLLLELALPLVLFLALPQKRHKEKRLVQDDTESKQRGNKARWNCRNVQQFSVGLSPSTYCDSVTIEWVRRLKMNIKKSISVALRSELVTLSSWSSYAAEMFNLLH